MTVQIKLLKGFKNPINHEKNALSLLIKSNCELQEHLSNAIEKLLTSLTSIIDYYEPHDIYFYHKLQVKNGRKTDYLKTKAYKTKLVSIKIDLSNSIEDLLSIAYGKFVSHFVNVTILSNDETLELSNDEFSKLNHAIRSKLSPINCKEHNFVDDDGVERTEKIHEGSLFIDDNDVERTEKIHEGSLFIDDNDVERTEKIHEGSLFIDDNDVGQNEGTTAQIKPLKGFKNYINGEHNTLSLLIKSNCKLEEHLSNAREKLLTSLTSIIDYYEPFPNYELYFYHKLQVKNGRRTEYPKTRAYKTKLDSIEMDLSDSMEDLLSIAHGEFVSHFVNITILSNDETLELSNDEFSKLNHAIRSKLSPINCKEHDFADNDKYDDDPFEKDIMNAKNPYLKIDIEIKRVNKKYNKMIEKTIELKPEN